MYCLCFALLPETQMSGVVVNRCDTRDAEENFFEMGEQDGSVQKGDEKNGVGPALLTTLMTFSVRREKARWSWC